MSRFEGLDVAVVADLCERGFQLVDSAKCVSGSMLPVSYSGYSQCFQYKSGSIANFKEVFITSCHYDSDAEDYVLSVMVHKFAESGEYFVDSESLVYKYIPANRISEYLRQQGIYTREEREQKLRERRRA